MNADDYQRLSAQTVNNNLTFMEEASNWALGIAGEAGEVADAIKKNLYHSKPLAGSELAGELGDVLWYVAQLATLFHLSMGDIMQGNLDKLAARHPNGFDPSYHSEALNGSHRIG